MVKASVALIGYGAAGMAHGALIDAEPRLELKQVMTRSPERIKQVRKRHPQARVSSFLDQMLDDDIDVVVIASPPASHCDIALLALEAGKHVVIDKPMTVTTAEAIALLALSKEVGRALIPFHNRRWDADFLTVSKLLETHHLGNVHTVACRWDRFVPAVESGWREESRNGDGGVLLDLGTHMIDQALVLFGDPVSVTAELRTERQRAVVDDAFDVVLHYDRFRVSLAANLLVRQPGPRWVLHGEHGSFVKYGIDRQNKALLDGRKPGSPGWGIEPRPHWGALRTGEVEIIPSERGRYQDIYKRIAAAVLDGAPPPVEANDALRVAHVIELARRSSDERRTIRAGD